MKLDMDFSQEKKYRLISGSITAVVMAIIVIICLAFGYNPPDPPIPEEGVEVNLGNSDFGQGDNPIPDASEAANPAPAASSAQENVSTQTTEESVSMNTTPTPTPKVTKPTPNESKPTETKPKEPEVNQKALFPGKKSNTSGGNQGVAGGQGNQGKEGGNPNSNNYNGTPGNGGSGFSLEGRSARALPTPTYDSQKQGKVVVKIWVDREGNVVNAEAPAKGSTITESAIVQKALAAAKVAKFSASSTAAEVQTGTITYVFKRSN